MDTGASSRDRLRNEKQGLAGAHRRGLLQEIRIASGPLFRAVSKAGKVRAMTISELDELFHQVLNLVKLSRPDLLRSDKKVEEAFSVRRSVKRGATTQAGNVGVPDKGLRANNNWRQYLHSQGVVTHPSIVARYSEAKANLLLMFSSML